jgi:hypothetical protein
LIGAPPLDPALRARNAAAGHVIGSTTAVARDRGGSYNLDHAVWVLLGASAATRARGRPRSLTRHGAEDHVQPAALTPH